jgi:hypothetical protein
MRTPEQQAAFEAMQRMDPLVVLGAQVTLMQCAVRALIQTSPDPTQTRACFDQLLGQIQAYPGFTGSGDLSLVVRDLAATLFRPPASPGT